MRIRLHIVILLLMLSLTDIHASEHPEYYRRWMNLPSSKLIEMGAGYGEIQNHPDSALVCFSIVSSRYKPDMTKAQKRDITQAYIGKWYVYFFCFFDYSQAFENLTHAQEIAESTGEGIGRVFLNFGCTYQTISEQSGDMKPDSLALDYYRKSYWQSKKEKDYNTLEMTMANMITVSSTLKCLDQIGKEMADYRKIKTKDETHAYNLLLYTGLSNLQKGNYQQAINAFDKQLAVMKDNIGNARYIYVNHTNKARVYAAQGNYRKAIAQMNIADSTAHVLDMKDARLEVYSMMSEYYEKLGMKQETENYRNRYFRLKDTLLNYHQVASVGELRFLGEMKKVDKQLQKIEHQRRVQSIIIKSVVGIIIIILIAMIVVWRKNKLLRQRNETLYLKNIEMLRREEEYRNQRKELKQVEIKRNEDRQKYKSSSLDETSKQQLMARIRDVMENSQEIYSTDFSGQQLASLVDAKYNYVSQVINESSGMNFNTFVNEYRIIEACKRLNDKENYGNFTIEAISNSVGFKSRTTFIQSFKRYTGLTPSDYLKIARQR